MWDSFITFPMDLLLSLDINAILVKSIAKIIDDKLSFSEAKICELNVMKCL